MAAYRSEGPFPHSFRRTTRTMGCNVVSARDAGLSKLQQYPAASALSSKFSIAQPTPIYISRRKGSITQCALKYLRRHQQRPSENGISTAACCEDLLPA